MRADMFPYKIPRRFIQWHSKVLKDVAKKTAVFWDVQSHSISASIFNITVTFENRKFPCHPC
jgi:hypothetical protein